MKRLLLLPLAALALSGCVLEITGGWYGGTVYPPDYSGADLHVYGLSVDSDYHDGGGRIICDDRTTTLSYTFSYTGDLSSWTSSLIGRNTGAVSATRTFYRADYPAGGTVTVTYSIPAGTAPLAVDRVGAQSVIVVPQPTVSGYTALRLTVRTSGGASGTVEFREIPVVSTCS
jgi:hypothetical protein